MFAAVGSYFHSGYKRETALVLARAADEPVLFMRALRRLQQGLA